MGFALLYAIIWNVWFESTLARAACSYKVLNEIFKAVSFEAMARKTELHIANLCANLVVNLPCASSHPVSARSNLFHLVCQCQNTAQNQSPGVWETSRSGWYRKKRLTNQRRRVRYCITMGTTLWREEVALCRTRRDWPRTVSQWKSQWLG